MRLVLSDSIKCREYGLADTLDKLREILSSWKTPVIVVDRDNRVVGNEEYCYALKILGVKYIPVALEGESNKSASVLLDVLNPFYELEENIRKPRVYENTIELLYRGFPTPLVKLKYPGIKGVTVWAKLEWYNPFSLSVKDRIAWYMLKHAMEKGLTGKVLYEATSTNTGLALAGISNYYGFKTRLYLPVTMQKCIDVLFNALGAEVVRKGVSITVEMIDDVKRDAERDGAINLNQFENDYNFYVHLRYTAKEIDYQSRTAGFIPDAIIAGIGTSGHLSAIAFYFKNKYGNGIRIYAVQPKQGSIIPGIRRVETGMKWIKHVSIDKIINVSLEEAVEGVIGVARSDGLLIGLSAGAVAYALRKVVEEEGLSGNIVAVFPDHGTKYMEILEGVLSKACPQPLESEQ